jgi:Putative sensor
MNTAITPNLTVPTQTPSATRRSPMRRFFGVVAQGQSYRNIAYLLLGLAVATVWLTVLVTALSISLSLVVVALLGIPLLLGTWYVIRAFANVERGLVNVLLGRRLRSAPMASGHRGNPWVRLVAMSRERSRWRELAYLFVRVPIGIATFATAVVALAVPFAIVWTPIHARQVDDFGDWSGSSELHDVASSPWGWGLVPLGVGLVLVSMHLLNALAGRCGRLSAGWLDIDRQHAGADLAEVDAA